MKILLVEDEQPAMNRLVKLIKENHPSIEIIYKTDSIKDCVQWLATNPKPDAMLLDIQLSDGLSFEILERLTAPIPFVFITASDHYAIKAFKLNSVDYLLKPIELEDLSRAMNKLSKQVGLTGLVGSASSDDLSTLAGFQLKDISYLVDQLKQSTQAAQFKERFLIKVGDSLKYVPTEKVAYIYTLEGYTHLVTISDKRLVIDYSLDQLTQELNPRMFFRISRKMIVNHKAVYEIHSWFTGRLKLQLEPHSTFEVLVSRERVNEFKKWLNK
jgi:DNA-binding LytR/AlgR family response regulator